MRCVLSETLPVTRYATAAEIAWMERRPELGAICRQAREVGRRITTELVERALPGVTAAGAKNIIAWCAMLGLCDAQGALTHHGDVAADKDEAPVPEQGVFDLWVVSHPLVGRRALHAERITAKADGRFELITPLKTTPVRGRVHRSAVDPSARFEVRALLPNDEAPVGITQPTDARCELRWTMDFTANREHWTLNGALDGESRSPRPIKHEPEQAGEDLDLVLRAWGDGPLAPFGRWQPDARRLARPFDGLSVDEQDHFTQRLTLPEAEVSGRGRWKNVTLDEVPIGPATRDDATHWAMARLDRRLRAKPQYRTRDEVRGLYAELTEATPLEALRPMLRSHDDLLSQYAGDPDVFWSLAAPVDLAPVNVDPAQLGALQVGVPAIAKARTDDVISVPYRCGWSMQTLTRELLSGTTPRRGLLCDRYVRGDANLAMLDLLVRSLRDVVPTFALEVWTDCDAEGLRAISAITGAKALPYREVFVAPPHDRYVLLGANGGAPFGWQMSNSPLDARIEQGGSPTPRTPLRWRDMTAVKHSTDQLPPRLATWLKEVAR